MFYFVLFLFLFVCRKYHKLTYWPNLVTWS